MGIARRWFETGIRRLRSFAAQRSPQPGPRPRLGVALGGGFARGIAHVGVLRVLQAEGIQVDCISGTSVGALIAAAYASGAPLDAIGRRAVSTTFRDFARWNLSRYGLASNDRLESYLQEFCGSRKIEELNIPLAIATTDLLTGEPYVITHGEIGSALRASAAYPGLFRPVELDGRVLVDGFLTSPVPADAARSLGAEVVIAVYLGTGPATEKPRHMADILWRAFAIMQNRALRRGDNRADVLIIPAVGDFAWDDFQKANELIATGERAARAALPQIRELLAARREPAPARGTAKRKLRLAPGASPLP
jgi:NTE family protein